MQDQPARPRPAWRQLHGIHLAGPLAALLAAGVLATSELGYRTDAELVARRDAATQTRLTVGRARRMVLTMESAERGYMLTGHPEYREPYDAALKENTAIVDSLRALAERAPAHRENLALLIDATGKKVAELKEVMRLFDSGERERAQALMLTGIGREQMERIEDLVNEMVRQEDAAAANAARQREAVRWWTLAALLALVLLSLGAAVAAMRASRERERERADHLLDLQAERDKLEGEVARRTQELSSLARHLQTVREDERRRLARELHDELGGLLTAAKLDVARLRKRLLPGAAPELTERLQHLGEMLDGGIALKRRIIEDLSPSSLANLGLVRTLEIQCAEFAHRAELQVDADIADVGVSDERALAVYRIVQEALTNVAKYARARRVQVGLHPDGEEHVRLQVRDDGAGFDPEALPNGTHGLTGMRFRVESCGGEWSLQSSPGRGTLVDARLPTH